MHRGRECAPVGCMLIRAYVERMRGKQTAKWAGEKNREERRIAGTEEKGEMGHKRWEKMRSREKEERREGTDEVGGMEDICERRQDRRAGKEKLKIRKQLVKGERREGKRTECTRNPTRRTEERRREKREVKGVKRGGIEGERKRRDAPCSEMMAMKREHTRRTLPLGNETMLKGYFFAKTTS